MLNISIVDDDKSICNEIENILEEYLKSNYIKYNIDTFYSGKKFIDYLKNENTYDIVFLDIEIGDLTGLDVGKYIRDIIKNRYMKIVYISFFKQYALELFDLQPTNFLIKPVKKEKIEKTIRNILEVINTETNIFTFKSERNIFKIPLRDILYFESIKNTKNIKIKTINMEKSFQDKISEVHKKIGTDVFLKANKSIIVNFNHIEMFSPKEMIITLSNNENIKISRLRLNEIKEKYIEYF